MPHRPDDVAQVVLRALLAGPALGLAAGLLLSGHLRRLVGLVPFTLGAGLGLSLVLAALGLVALPLRRRWLAGAAGLALVALLPPVPLLAGEFAVALLDHGSSRVATVELLDLYEDAPLTLLDPWIALGAALALAGLVVGRPLGWRAVTQAAVGAWVVLLGLGALFAAGQLAHPPLALVLAVCLGLATAGPFAVELADRAVRALRRGEARRVAALLGLLLAPALVAGAWAAAVCTEVPWPVTYLARPEPTAAACALAVQSLLQRPRGPLRSRTALLVGALAGGWAFVTTPDVPGWEQAASLVGLGALAAVLADRLAGAGGGARPWRTWLALVAALTLAVTAGGLLRPLQLGGGASGLEARVHFGLRLGADPFALRRWTETLGHRPGQGEGWDRVLRLPSGGLSMDLDHLLLTRAAEAGDGLACRELWQRGKRAHAHFGPSEDDRRWLRRGAALGDPECVRELRDDEAAR